MTTFRPNYNSSWRQREMEKYKARKEAEQKAKDEAELKKIAKTEENFPTVMSAAAGGSKVAFDTKFSELAREWQTSNDTQRAMEEIRKQREYRQQQEMSGVFIHRKSRWTQNDDENEWNEPPTQHQAASTDEWQEVKRKAKKTARELTEGELAQKYARALDGDSSEEDDHNSHLFDNRRRDDLY